MAKVTRIKASDPGKPREPDAPQKITRIKAGERQKVLTEEYPDEEVVENVLEDNMSAIEKREFETADAGRKEKKARKKGSEGLTESSKESTKGAKKDSKAKKPAPKGALGVITWPFRMILKPFFALGRYLRDSWRELRQVRWPSRKATWQMFLAILVYTVLIVGFIMLLDVLFTWLFNLILGE